MTRVLVAPTEPVALRERWEVSSLPERFGADVFWTVTRDARGLKVGVQRKEWKDLITSVEDARWARELAAMRALDVRFVVVEVGRRSETTACSSTNGSVAPGPKA